MHRLCVWQQNLNNSLWAQLDMLHSLKPDRYDIVLIQEPYVDFQNRSHTNLQFTAVYPTLHAARPGLLRSLILVNTNIPSHSWTQIPLNSSDLTGIELTGEFRTIRLINVYNDCDQNQALEVLSQYLRDPASAAHPDRPVLYIW
ncbi:hypothetical protein C8R45DRAFT_838515 [Mycena sanguinolenta]|nr:hypothetical protein C8R45DRAFT_838515 [Mycena sanguinolenta]